MRIISKSWEGIPGGVVPHTIASKALTRLLWKELSVLWARVIPSLGTDSEHKNKHNN